jgi:hypothetical protein
MGGYTTTFEYGEQGRIGARDIETNKLVLE